MKTITILSIIVVGLGVHASLLVSSCAPNPVLQKQMDQDILKASESTKAKNESETQGGERDTRADQGGF